MKPAVKYPTRRSTRKDRISYRHAAIGWMHAASVRPKRTSTRRIERSVGWHCMVARCHARAQPTSMHHWTRTAVQDCDDFRLWVRSIVGRPALDDVGPTPEGSHSRQNPRISAVRLGSRVLGCGRRRCFSGIATNRGVQPCRSDRAYFGRTGKSRRLGPEAAPTDGRHSGGTGSTSASWPSFHSLRSSSIVPVWPTSSHSPLILSPSSLAVMVHSLPPTSSVILEGELTWQLRRAA